MGACTGLPGDDGYDDGPAAARSCRDEAVFLAQVRCQRCLLREIIRDLNPNIDPDTDRAVGPLSAGDPPHGVTHGEES